MTDRTPARPATEAPLSEILALTEQAEQLEETVQTLAAGADDAIRRYEAGFDRSLTPDELAPASQLLTALGALHGHLEHVVRP